MIESVVTVIVELAVESSSAYKPANSVAKFDVAIAVAA